MTAVGIVISRPDGLRFVRPIGSWCVCVLGVLGVCVWRGGVLCVVRPGFPLLRWASRTAWARWVGVCVGCQATTSMECHNHSCSVVLPGPAWPLGVRGVASPLRCVGVCVCVWCVCVVGNTVTETQY